MSKSISERLKGQIYMDPRLDTGFKTLFASKEALKDFLDAALRLHGEERIKELNYSFDHALRFIVPKERMISLDAFATTGTKRFLDIEMQKAEHSFFIDRTVLYKAGQIIKAKQEMENTEEFKLLSDAQKEYRRYEIPESISIWICDFDLPETMGNYLDEWAIYSQESLKNGKVEPICLKNRYIMINLPKFNKTVDEIKDALDIWLYVLKHAADGKVLPDFGSTIVSNALDRIRIDNLDRNTLNELEREMTTKDEINCCIASAVVRKQLEIVDAMFAKTKLTDEDIAAISGFPVDEIAKRRAERQ